LAARARLKAGDRPVERVGRRAEAFDRGLGYPVPHDGVRVGIRSEAAHQASCVPTARGGKDTGDDPLDRVGDGAAVGLGESLLRRLTCAHYRERKEEEHAVAHYVLRKIKRPTSGYSAQPVSRFAPLEA